MTTYQYIAESNPDAAFELCKRHGYYNINDLNELGNTLTQIVANGNENDFAEVMALHPDGEMVIAGRGVTNPPPPPEQPKQLSFAESDCPCKKLNATGDGSSVINQTSLYILAGAAIIAFAIISSRK